MGRLVSVAVWCVGGILLWGAAEKVIHWQRFLLALEGYAFVPQWAAGGGACAILLLEAYAGGSVLFARTRSHGLVLSAVLFALFAGAVGFLLATKPGSSCGCTYSLGQAKADLPHLFLNVSLTILSVYLAVVTRQRQPEPLPPGSAEAGYQQQSTITHQSLWRST